LNIRILGGAHEIGGNCVELEFDGKRLLLDLGRPLSAGWDDVVPLPDVVGLEKGDDSSLCGIVISHGHQDHYGLLVHAHPNVPVYMGEDAANILAAAAFFTKNPVVPKPAGFLKNENPLDIGPFRVTPYLVDHSAFDAYALLVEAGGERLFYTGDLRAHGRKGALFQRLISNPPPNIDVLLSEATNVRADDAPAGPVWTEDDLEQRFADAFKATDGLALVTFSAQNIDRLVTLYRAAKRAGRTLVVDLYTATIAKATGRASIPQPPVEGKTFEKYLVYVPKSLRIKIKKLKEFKRVNWIKDVRIFPEELAAHPEQYVLMFRGSMMDDLAILDKQGGLVAAQAWWSLWKGYLEEPSGIRLQKDLVNLGIPLNILHTSGHASVEDLRILIKAINASKVIYMHTEHPDAASVIG
jgi:ribonuclease J